MVEFKYKRGDKFLEKSTGKIFKVKDKRIMEHWVDRKMYILKDMDNFTDKSISERALNSEYVKTNNTNLARKLYGR